MYLISHCIFIILAAFCLRRMWLTRFKISCCTATHDVYIIEAHRSPGADTAGNLRRAFLAVVDGEVLNSFVALVVALLGFLRSLVVDEVVFICIGTDFSFLSTSSSDMSFMDGGCVQN